MNKKILKINEINNVLFLNEFNNLKIENLQYKKLFAKLKHKLRKIIDFSNLQYDSFDMESSSLYDIASNSLDEISKCEMNNNTIVNVLQNLYFWIEQSCFIDETIKVILSKIQCEINKQRNLLKEQKKK